MYNCEKHGEMQEGVCDECGKMLCCDCSDQETVRFKDMIYDVDGIGERTVTIYLTFCATCGDAISSNI